MYLIIKQRIVLYLHSFFSFLIHILNYKGRREASINAGVNPIEYYVLKRQNKKSPKWFYTALLKLKSQSKNNLNVFPLR